MIPVLRLTLVLVPPLALLGLGLALPVVGLVARSEPEAVQVLRVTVRILEHGVVDPGTADNVAVQPGKVTGIILGFWTDFLLLYYNATIC